MVLTLKERAYNHIRAKLLNGELTAGDRLSDAAIAAEIGISRTPVREAITQLVSDGLLEQVPRFGAFVRMPRREEVQEMYQLRELLETHVVARAIERISDNEVAELERLCTEMRGVVEVARAKAKDGAYVDPLLHYQWVLNDCEFHMRILRAAGNRWVLRIIDNFRVMSTLFAPQTGDPAMRRFSNMAWTYREHMQILRAVRRRDAAETRRWLTANIRGGMRKAMAFCDGQPQPEPSAAATDHESWMGSLEALRSRINVYRSSIAPDHPAPRE